MPEPISPPPKMATVVIFLGINPNSVAPGIFEVAR
uniref:Uncharacterized protein n=1 Tax=Arundo donax TaxID=35708 RepID=A0A0A9EZ96_ARUDO